MKVKTLLISFLLFITSETLAQTSLPVYNIEVDTPVKKLPDANWKMLIDYDDKWKFADMKTLPVKTSFHHNSTKDKGVGYSGITTYWQFAKLKNSVVGKELNIVFTNSPVADQFNIYVVRSTGKIDSFKSGSLVPYGEKSGDKIFNAVPVVLSEDEEVTIYKRLYTKRSSPHQELIFGFTFFDDYVEEEMINKPWYKNKTFLLIIACLLIIGSCFNFFFFCKIKEIVFLFLSLLLLIKGVGYVIQVTNLFFTEMPVTGFYYDLLVNHLLFFTLITFFVRYYLKSFHHHPKWDNVILNLLALTIVSALSGTFILRDNTTYTYRGIPDFAISIIFLLLMITLLLCFLYFKKTKGKYANVSVIAVLPVFFLWSFGYFTIAIFNFLNLKNGTETKGFFNWLSINQIKIEAFFLVWFAIGFTWILMQRFKKGIKNKTLSV